MSIVKTQWKILCMNHEACPDIVKNMEGMNFDKVIMTKNDPNFDIIGDYPENDDKETQKKAQQLINDHRGKIQSITIVQV